VVIGCSAGGFSAISYLLSHLPADFNVPVIIVQHRSRENDHLLEKILQEKSPVKVKQADEKEKINPGHVYIAPPDYHLLIEQDGTFSLTVEKEMGYSRPSINVLFETAAQVYGARLTGILLTGASNDGAAGIKAIREHGGTTVAQDPEEAAYPIMPKSAIDTGTVQHKMKLTEILTFLTGLSHGNINT
jgi:two-component system chemotaxis response regulator CheB